MAHQYWPSSNDVSVESSQGESRDASSSQEEASEVPKEGSNPRSSNDGAVARVMDTKFPLPNLQPHQHASLFYLSLIEGRCRTQAANSINAARRLEDHLPEDHPEICDLSQHLFAEMSKELVKAGMISEEFAGQPLPELRLYLNSFDSILNNIATKRHSDLSNNNSYRAIAGPSYVSLSGAISTTSFIFSKALIRQQPLLMASLRTSQDIPERIPSPFLEMFSPYLEGKTVPDSKYTTQYKQLSLLGKGGFGQVFRAQYYLDKKEYAIKEIVIRADNVRALIDQGKWRGLIKEVETFSKLENRHVARYHYSWVELRPATSTSSSEQDLESGETASLNSELAPNINNITSGTQSIQLGIEHDLKTEMQRVRRNSTTHEASEDMVVFEDDSAASAWSNSAKRASTKPEKLGFFKGADESDGSDEDDEGSESTVDLPLSSAHGQIPEVNFDAVLYIAMAPYPLSLEDYIFLDEAKNPLTPKINHCFHTQSSARILLAILDGVEYLHRQEIIHRDLKPGNIFLSILPDREPPTDGYIDVTNCGECGIKGPTLTSPVRICPLIGDFGLVVDLKDIKPHTPGSSGTTNDSKPFPYSAHTNTQQAGTKFYCPRTVPKIDPICRKLDVYSFGVIAFELITKFSTKTERIIVLSELAKGKFPKEFEEHHMAEGIRGMLRENRDERWDCAMIREWLKGIIEMGCA